MVVPVCSFCYRFFCHHCLELETFTFFKGWEGAGYNGPLRLEPAPPLQCFHLERHGDCCSFVPILGGAIFSTSHKYLLGLAYYGRRGFSAEKIW